MRWEARPTIRESEYSVSGSDVPRTSAENAATGDASMASLVRAADDAVAAMAGEYLSWAEAELGRLGAAIEGVEADRPAPATMAAIQDSLHNLKGTSPTFGFPLVGQIAQSGMALVKNRAALAPSRLDLLRDHAAALSVVLGNRIHGDGGDSGRQLLRRLDERRQALGA